MISISNLHKRFKDVNAVNGISFEIPKGELFGLLGPNGAGKTTTINMMVGVLKPDDGTITINGVTDPTRSDIRFRLGNAPQSLALYDRLTARENLNFFGGLYNLKGKRLKERVDWALDFVGLTDRADHRIETFSGGMKRRVNLACAVVHDPDVILFDEPTVGVDPQSRNMIFDTIEELKRGGRTIIYTTHYMEEAERLCDRVAIVDHGTILALDSVDGLIDSHGGDSLITGEAESTPENMANFAGSWDGPNLKHTTSQPMQDLAKLTGLGVNFRQLKVERPNLEDVFLNLTGRSLRD